MSLAALLDISTGEILLILAIILVLLGAKRLPEICEGIRQGLKEFRTATREVADEINLMVHGEHANWQLNLPLLAEVTFWLCAAFVLLSVVYELFR
jgi:TatA/E family protein of Tat protein translocase